MNAGKVDTVRSLSLMFTLLSSMVVLPLPCFCLTMTLCLPTVTPLYDLTTQSYSHESCQSQKRCTPVTERQLSTAGTQKLLEPSRALPCIVPNPQSDCDQARDSKGNTNTLQDSGCLSIFPIPLFLKKEIKRRTACGFLFSWDLWKFWEQNRINFVASSHFFCTVENILDLQGSCKPCHG